MTINRYDEEKNLVVALHKWARSQDENFTTEVFAHLLKYWIHEQPKAALAVLRKITADFPKLTDADCPELEIILQRRVDGNQPDIRIESRDGRNVNIIIEVKVRQPVNWPQIKKYSEELKHSKCIRPCLALLTKNLVEQEGCEESTLVHSYVLWHQVAECIREELRKNEIEDPVSNYLATQFVGFLKWRGMTMEKVGTDLVEGVRSLSSLTKMLEDAVLSDISQRADWDNGPIVWDGNSIGLYWGPRKSTTRNKDWHYWSGVFDGNGGVLVLQAYY